MDSKTTEVKRPTSVEIKTVVASEILQEIIDEILKYLFPDFDFKSLRSYSLVSKPCSIVPPAPLPHHPLHFDTYDQMDQGIPGTQGESRPSYQGFKILGRAL